MPGLETVSPIDGSVCVERPYATHAELGAALDAARKAQLEWRGRPLEERQRLCTGFVDAFVARKQEIARELTLQMGRPIRYAPLEVAGTEERARGMIALAPEGLQRIDLPERSGFERYIERTPLGVVLVVPAWNYPYLISVNAVVPALLAGNAVVLKPSSQTPLCGERFAEAFAEAGLPPGLFTCLHLDHATTAAAVGDRRVDFVAFTGSVSGGHTLVEAARSRFIGMGLELGGKDPAYVRADADLSHAVENLVDGALFNSGQSCCGIERIYVDQRLYGDFVEAYAEQVRGYVLGDPRDEATTLGPLARARGADDVRAQIRAAQRDGARALIDASSFERDAEGTPYLAPQVLVDVDHGMAVMTEETFGPVVGIMKVASDEEAVRLMNDSDYGLTASVWTADLDVARALGARVETGTWFMNRCDYLDPQLAWVGVKDSGRGCTLSRVGYEHLTRPKSFHLRTPATG